MLKLQRLRLEVIDFGTQYTTQTHSKEFVIENRGRQPRKLVWTLEPLGIEVAFGLSFFLFVFLGVHIQKKTLPQGPPRPRGRSGSWKKAGLAGRSMN